MKFYTVEQVASMLQVSNDDVLQWLSEKRLSAIKIGDYWRIGQQQLQAFWDSHLVGDIPITISDVKKQDDAEPVDYSDLLTLNQSRAFDEIRKPKIGRGRKPTGQYKALEEYLQKKNAKQLQLTFRAIEDLLGKSLPASARTQKAWWSNSMGHTQAKAWMQAGWSVSKVDFDEELVVLKRRQ